MRLCSRHHSIQLNARQEAEKTTTVEPRFNVPVEASNVINDPKCNKGPKCNNFWP